MTRPLVLALISMILVAPVFAQDSDGHNHGPVEDVPAAADPATEATARALEGRIKSPCCWNQTLDIHGSPVAQELKAEIRTRLVGGETAREIQDSIVARYGERVLAVPPDSPLGTFALLSLLAAFAAGGGIFLLGLKWRGKGEGGGGDGPGASGKSARERNDGDDGDADGEYDARLDAELNDA
ncbi:MAG: cytochrome c-type biogenesis protein CcmH [Deltaproteobacteria bacterium]|nr:cytochrome c-type biogenesis protein CcmH [Deltaproteobacteria bacterium]